MSSETKSFVRSNLETPPPTCTATHLIIVQSIQKFGFPNTKFEMSNSRQVKIKFTSISSIFLMLALLNERLNRTIFLPIFSFLSKIDLLFLSRRNFFVFSLANFSRSLCFCVFAFVSLHINAVLLTIEKKKIEENLRFLSIVSVCGTELISLINVWESQQRTHVFMHQRFFDWMVETVNLVICGVG